MAEKSHRTINPETGKRCARQTIIMDMDQLSYYQVSNPACRSYSVVVVPIQLFGYAKFILFYFFTFQTVAEIGIETTRLTQNNYPEGVRKVFLINGMLI